MKILITGGHLTPALGLIEYLSEESSKHQVVFLGRKYTQESGQQLSHEMTEVGKYPVLFIPYFAPKDLGFNFNSLFFPIRFLASFFKAIFILIKHRPQVYVSFGGYMSLPVGLACYLFQIPIVVHEQTKVIGQANKLLAKFAKYVAVSFAQTKAQHSHSKFVLTGNIVRQDLFQKASIPDWAKDIDKSIIYITGGNQGSYVLNNTIKQCLNYLTKNFTVIWACGNKTSRVDSKKDILQAAQALTSGQKSRLIVQEWFADQELAYIFQNATIMISRAGANTVYESLLFRIPTIFIPLPFAKNNEQYLNVKDIEDQKACVVIPQKELNQEKVIFEIKKIYKYRNSYLRKLKNIDVIKDGAARLFQLLSKVVSK